MRYILKHSAGDVYFIRYGGRRIGQVTTRVGNKQEWIARIGDLTAYGTSRKAAFEAIVTKRNRIQLCGEDDPVKAREALAKRNAEVERRNEEQREFERPIVEAVERFARAANLPMPRYTRPRRRRILI